MDKHVHSILPIAPNERIMVLDQIRGFALFGIFLVNMLAFHSPWLYMDLKMMWPEKSDRWTDLVIDIFAQASFYPLFSFLFGYGMVLFIQRLRQKGLKAGPYISRRLLVLLGIGLVHAFLIWHGDILISYAIVGTLFLLFLKIKPQTKVKWAIGLLIIPALILTGLFMLLEMQDPEGMASLVLDKRLANKALDHYSNGTWWDITQQRIHDWYYVHNLYNAPFLLLSILPMFILGGYAAESKLFEELPLKKRFVAKICIWTGIFGISIKVLPYFFSTYSYSLSFIQDMIGGPLLAIFYASGIGVLSLQKRVGKYLKPLEYVGRLSLSNYLFQSIICTLIFYSYGLGLYGQVRPVYGLGLNIVIFSIQIILSKRWLQRYTQGPMEWVWRRLTYGTNKAHTI